MRKYRINIKKARKKVIVILLNKPMKLYFMCPFVCFNQIRLYKKQECPFDIFGIVLE